MKEMKMKDEINDGGPAFPSHGTMGEVVQVGMALRDYFAGQALMSMLGPVQSISSETPALAAKYAYEFADAMLRARGQEGEG